MWSPPLESFYSEGNGGSNKRHREIEYCHWGRSVFQGWAINHVKYRWLVKGDGTDAIIRQNGCHKWPE